MLATCRMARPFQKCQKGCSQNRIVVALALLFKLLSSTMETATTTASSEQGIVAVSSSEDSTYSPKDPREMTAEEAEKSSLSSDQLKMTMHGTVSEDDNKSTQKDNETTRDAPNTNETAVVSDSSTPAVCTICGQGDSECKRLCYFEPNGYSTLTTIVHVFCGKTAAILPNINRPELEILTKSGIKNKHGTATPVLVAMQRSRAATVTTPSTTSGSQQTSTTYYLVKEVEEHLYQLTNPQAIAAAAVLQQMPQPPMPPQVCAPYAGPPPTTVPVHDDDDNATHTYTNPRPPPETMAHYKSIQPPEIPSPRPPPQEPPSKKLKTMEQQKSPYEVLMERLQEKSKAVGGVGYSLVRGVSPATCDEDYAEEDEALFNPNLCSPSQVDHVRILIITESRQYYMQYFINQVSEQDNTTLQAWNTLQEKYALQKSQICKFDMLLGFTDAIKDYNDWMTFPEQDWNDDMLCGLARMWNVLLKKPNHELGIDAEFTRPGVLCLLQDFKDQVEAASLEFPFVGEE